MMMMNSLSYMCVYLQLQEDSRCNCKHIHSLQKTTYCSHLFRKLEAMQL